jgi:hypothetical protein
VFKNREWISGFRMTFVRKQCKESILNENLSIDSILRVFFL